MIFSFAKLLLLFHFCKVLVSPFAFAICNYAEIVVSLQHFCKRLCVVRVSGLVAVLIEAITYPAAPYIYYVYIP